MQIPKILIVDDEAGNIKLLKAMLSLERYELLSAGNGGDALRITSETPVDLILLDVMMPGINGFEVCRRLKKDAKTKIIPVVMVTALREKEHRVQAMEAGADDFLSKPVERTEVLIRIKAMLRIKGYQDELLQNNLVLAEKNEKLMELEKTKEGLTHMIIHDLNNPLHAITGTLELMLLKAGDGCELDHNQMKKCLMYCNEMNQQVQGLLDVHRMEEAQLKLDIGLINLYDLINELTEMVKLKSELKAIILSLRMPEKAPLVRVDGGLIKRVLANLLNNAMRHTHNGGRVEIGVDQPAGKGEILVSVKDTGDGLAPEYHEKVFNKFEQVKLRKKGVSVGSSGLGLYFCKMAVETHGGKIWVESEGEGKGSNFIFSLPLSA